MAHLMLLAALISTIIMVIAAADVNCNWVVNKLSKTRYYVELKSFLIVAITSYQWLHIYIHYPVQSFTTSFL